MVQLSEDVIRDLCSWPDIKIDVTEFGLQPRLPPYPNTGDCYENDFLFQQQQEEPNRASSPSTSHEASETQTGPELCGRSSPLAPLHPVTEHLDTRELWLTTPTC